MRAVRYSGAAIAAGILVVAAVATVAAARTERIATDSTTIHLDVATPAGGAPALGVHLIVGTDAAPLLVVDGLLPDATGAGRVIAYRGEPVVSALALDPALQAGSVVASFTGPDGTPHVLRADVRASGAVEAWTDGPYAPDLDGTVAALRACGVRAVHADASVSLDGLPVDLFTPAVSTADLVARSCSTVAIRR